MLSVQKVIAANTFTGRTQGNPRHPLMKPNKYVGIE